MSSSDFKSGKLGRLLAGATVTFFLLGILLTSGFAAQAFAQGSQDVTSITFDTFPDGTAITTDTILAGDEFSAKGILVAGAPESSYCAQATSAAVLVPPTFNPSVPDFNFLSTADPGDVNRCNAIPVEIVFVNPVQRVTLIFVGASTTYTMKVYDSAGGLLGTRDVEAVCCSATFEATFPSGGNNIKRVTFGRETAGTLVKEIRYEIQPSVTAFSFSLSSIRGMSVGQGESNTNTLTVALVSGTPEIVSLSLTGEPAGTTASFSPVSGTPTFSSTLTISTLDNAPPGTYRLTVSATGGSITESTNFDLTVNAGPSEPPPVPVAELPLDPAILVAIITAIGGIVVALIGILPKLRARRK